MKINTLFQKLTVYFLLLAPHLLLAQVGINSTGAAPSADAMLDVKSSNKGILIPRLSNSSLIPSPTLGLIFYNTSTNQFNYYNGTTWISITNAANATGWTVNGNDIYNSNTRNVGIGTTLPKAPFNVAAEKTVLFGTDSSGSGGKLLWYPSKSAFRVGYVVGTEWDYGNVGIYSSAMGIGTKASGPISTAMGQYSIANGPISTAMGQYTIASGPISTAMGQYTIASGSISTAMGSSTIASGNSSTAMGTFNIDVPTALLMVGNGTISGRSNALTVLNNGKIGIGTTAPIAPLHVSSSNAVAINNINRYFNYGTGSSINVLPSGSYNVGLLVDNDIVTKNSFVSAQTATTSDARIKNIIGLSNNQQDLDNVRQIQITDYRYKDVHTWGNQTFKKVIAQQVEEVYPQAVRKMTSIIPDIYALANQVVFEATSKNFTVTMSKNYDIKVGETIEFILEKEGKVQGAVASVAGNSFTVKNWQNPTNKIFVFGREVKDFRSVDYEAISMLGISAIQQLAKENELLLKGNELLLNEIKKLKDDGKELSTRLSIIEGLLSNYAKGK